MHVMILGFFGLVGEVLSRMTSLKRSNACFSFLIMSFFKDFFSTLDI